ncbi:sushi domain-containing protein 1 isoform X2 [Syngnathoides biaculeatus]|uniref:sushi domain-containing protein 1 isoform X2 n=1 Tax=Syngnathoides biaculeatus TaxID=300417 RepID=UPI002ADDDFDA|nr:sushi domain-containing protein 1 isoform X2 [Syngnathoides biaculeatus]
MPSTQRLKMKVGGGEEDGFLTKGRPHQGDKLKMDERSATVSLLLLFCLGSVTPAPANILDVCASCHVNATCVDKYDHSGKVCNCKYGFVGNGRTFCQDKDECQIGATKICGQHTTCHNTYGSYYCTCLTGYIASNYLPVFIPNDGTHCQDIDECRVAGLCGEGGQCRNLDGTFDCRCQLGYRVHNGTEPFRPQKNQASCQVVDCGQPTFRENIVLLSATGTTFGSVATFECDEGFLWKSGNKASACGADGLWRGLTIICEVIDCGSPPTFAHSHVEWNGSSRVGTEVLYQCNFGYRNIGKSNVFTCTAAGQWEGVTVLCQEILCGQPHTVPHTRHSWNGTSTPGSIVNYYCKQRLNDSEASSISLCSSNGNWTKPNISCKEVVCGSPPDVSHSIMLWDHVSTVGSQVAYQCQSGYSSVGEINQTVCTDTGKWETPSVWCQEIKCQEPVLKPHAKRLWDGTSRVGSMAIYECDEGYDIRGVRSVSLCGQNGLWEEVDLWCEEITCGPPKTLPHSTLLWDRSTGPGSVVQYECVDGYYQEGGDNISTCLTSGEWANISLNCKEVVWHNTSVVLHHCVKGYRSWSGSNVSTCSSSGVWHAATLSCIEVKQPINQLLVLNEKCLQWRAEKDEGAIEMYKVIYIGSREYERGFLDKRKQFVNSMEDWVQICLSLLPATNYSVSITALLAGFTATVAINTTLTVPAVPELHYREFETPVPTLRLHRSPSTLDTISLYQVFVLPIEGVLAFNCSCPVNGKPPSKSDSSQGHIVAQMRISRLGAEMNFTVGDGLSYGGFYNAPLRKGKNYYVILRAVSQWKNDLKSSCVLWAKVRGTSYVIMISSLCAAALIGLIVLAVLLGWTYTWFLKRR